MKERPILFSAPMVRAILDGSKTQTRRIVKPQPDHTMIPGGIVSCSTNKDDEGKHAWYDRIPLVTSAIKIRCPYGKPGDRLWVRETWKPIYESDTGFTGIAFRAGGMPEDDQKAGEFLDGTDRWRPSIHMPRWASRITLEITGIRVERLNDISPKDAEAEGIGSGFSDIGACYVYGQLWESIHSPGSWSANPWVWVVEFKRITP